MKKKIILLAIAASLVTSEAEAKNPGGSLLCLAGMLQGQDGGSACNGYINDYFSILSFKKGKFKAAATAALRAAFLNQTPGNDEIKQQINDAYGMLRFRP